MYIDGKWCEADGGRTLGGHQSGHEEVIEEIAYGGRAETRRAWRRRSGHDRLDENHALGTRQSPQEDGRANAAALGRHPPAP